jgi:hypothetical protein
MITKEKPVTEWLREHLLGGRSISYEYARACAKFKLAPSLDAVRRGPFGAEFRARRLARLIMGTWRYEVLGWNPRSFDVVDSAMSRLIAYRRSGNLEHLVDAANLIGLEWLRPAHVRSEWRGYGDDLGFPRANEARGALRLYQVRGNRGELALALDCLEAEYLNPSHPNAHWHDTHRGDEEDVGGVPER